MKSFYVDSCIYLNLWQKEGDERFGTPYWKSAKDFLGKFSTKAAIYYSGFLLKELRFILSEKEFDEKSAMFRSSPNFRKICLSAGELDEARMMELELKHNISFYDIIHILLAKKSNSVLITRDRKLLETAGKYGVAAKKPEDFL